MSTQEFYWTWFVSIMLTKEQIRHFYKISLFCICLAFVVHRGYKCFDKYLRKPKSSLTKIQNAGGLLYPSISFGPTTIFDSIDVEILKKCNLTLNQYLFLGTWTGEGSENYCSNAKNLLEKLIWHPKKLSHFEIFYKLINGKKFYEKDLKQFEMSKKWPNILYTIEMPKEAIKIGIEEIWITFSNVEKSLPEFWVYLSQSKSLMIDMPKKPERFKLRNGKQILTSVEHRIISQLDFDGLECSFSKGGILKPHGQVSQKWPKVSKNSASGQKN